MIRKGTYRKGFSLAEAMMATVVLGIAAAGVLVPFTTGAVVRAEGNHRTLAAKLASDMMEEIIKTPYDSIVSTYNGRTEAQGSVKNSLGAVFTGSNYAKFSRTVTCNNNACVGQEDGMPPYNFTKVTVEVFYGGKSEAVLVRLISR